MTSFHLLSFIWSVSTVLHEDAEEDSGGWVLDLETMRGACSHSWFDLCLAKLSGFSFQPGSSNITQQILMPVTSTTLLGIWQLRDWYGNSLFLSFTPTCYSICKGCDFRGQMGEVSIKRKKKKIQPSGSLEKNPLTYHVNGYNGLRCVMNIEDSDECERSLQTRRTGMSSGEPSVTEAGAEVVMGKKE